ncbi:MAG TPA: GNAT family N-acetyltransferase [Tepidisphaeraceae bacterium]|nr:GNAT family N-acetyltransferase [Tepidisphaeraceae bacterium]
MKETQNAAEFLKQAEGFLMEHEAENNLILGQALRLVRGEPVGHAQVLFYLVEDEGKVLVAGMHNQPYRLVLSRGPGPAIAMIADWAARKKVNLSGVIGIPESVTMFTRAWSKLSRDKMKGGHRLRIYQLEQLKPAAAVSGKLEPANMRELDLLTDWNIKFTRDVEQPLTGDERGMVQRAIEGGRLFVWKDPQPVSMAAWAGPTPRGVRVNMVYTPPELRRRGYASAAVSALTKKLLDSGRKFVFLFTDLSNPTSNKIYQQMGYQAVCDINEVDFAK